MTREELRDYVDEQRSLNMIPYHVYSALIDGIDTLEQEPTTKIEESNFSQEQYLADIQSAYDCGVASVNQKSRWIPVSERLPESDGKYLVLYDFGDDFYDYKVLNYMTESGDLWDKGWNKIDDMFNKMVDWSVDMVAWMPLPKPYKAESEG